jgi:hypothetical protein
MLSVTSEISAGLTSTPYIYIVQVPLDITDRHSQRVHRQDFGVESFKPRLVFLNQLRLERAIAIARHFDRHFASLTLQRLLALAIPRVASAVTGHLVLLIAEVMIHFAGQHALHQRLRQFLYQPVRADQAPAAGRDQLVN